MKIDKQVIISDKQGFSCEARLLGSLEGDEAILNLYSSLFNLLYIKSDDFFGCLLKIRERIEQKNLFILCQGSAKNVYPSRMARDMSSGLKAYTFELGKKASMANLVEIFDPAPMGIVCSIVEQEEFFKNWIAQPKF